MIDMNFDIEQSCLWLTDAGDCVVCSQFVIYYAVLSWWYFYIFTFDIYWIAFLILTILNYLSYYHDTFVGDTSFK